MKRSKKFFCGCSNEGVLKSYELVIVGLEVSRNIPKSRASELDMASFLMITLCTSLLWQSKFSLCSHTTVDFIP